MKEYYNLNFEPSYAYYRHYNSNPQFTEQRDPKYTFFSDMAAYCMFNDKQTALNKIQGYVGRMLKRFGKDTEGLLEMIDSLNLLGWVLYQTNGDKKDALTDWLFKEYERLFYEDWKDYLTEEEMSRIWYELN